MKVWITSPHGKDNLTNAFRALGHEVVNKLSTGVQLIIPTVDEELPFFARAKEYFEQQGIKVMVNSPTVIDLCRDKAEFYRVCKRHGVPTPATMQGDLILKPRFGKGSKGVQRIDRSQIVQEFVPFQEYSVDYFADWEGKPISCVQRQRLNVVNGEAQAAKIEWHGLIHKTVLRFAQELGLVGHNVIQGWLTDTGRTFIFGEINCRFGGGSHMTFEVFNSPKWLTDNISGKFHN